jgi:hypothetical protein
MTMPVRLLLALAALAYSFMPFTGMGGPALASAQVAVSQGVMPGDCPHASSGNTEKMSDPTSSHPEGVKFAGHCSACLTLPAEPLAWATGVPLRGAEVAALSPRLASINDDPLVPPPRA